MTQEEKAIIKRFASGETFLVEQAIAIHRKYIEKLGVRGTLEMAFMAEVDHPYPDFALRSTYRQRLIKGE